MAFADWVCGEGEEEDWGGEAVDEVRPVGAVGAGGVRQERHRSARSYSR